MMASASAQGFAIPHEMTIPCALYHAERFHLLVYSALSTVWLPESFDALIKAAAEGVDPEHVKPEFREQWQRHRERGAGMEQEMLLYERLAGEMYVSRAYSNFDAYLAELLALVFQKRPGKLGETAITVKEVLEYGNVDDVVAAAAEKKINDVSSKGIRELDKYFRSSHELRLFENDQEMEVADYIREVRNLITHKRGIVDRKRLASVPRLRGLAKVGEKVPLEGILEELGVLDRIVDSIDARMAVRYDLPRPVSDQGFWQILAAARRQATADSGSTTEPPKTESPSDKQDTA